MFGLGLADPDMSVASRMPRSVLERRRAVVMGSKIESSSANTFLMSLYQELLAMASIFFLF